MVLPTRVGQVSKTTKKTTTADLRKDREFAIKIALFNSLLFSFLLAAVTFVDARLKTRFEYGARVYRWGYLVSGLGGLLVLLGTSLALEKIPSDRWKLKSAFPTAILLIVGAASLPFFHPDQEFPHGGITTWAVELSFVSLVSCGFYYSKIPNRLLQQNLTAAIQRERVKEYAKHWRAIATALLGVYATVLVSQATLLYLQPSMYVTNPSEKIRLWGFSYSVLVGISLYAAYGILYAAWKKADEADDLLTKIKSVRRRPKASAATDVRDPS